MDIATELNEIATHLHRVEQKIKTGNANLFFLIDNLVKMHQKERLEKNYSVSDKLRELLSDAGVTIIQGTAGYDYENIPPALVGRQVDDTWCFKESK